jgi:hypothetical protein
MSEDPVIAAYANLLAIRNERRTQAADHEVAAIIERLRSQLVAAMRSCCDELERLDCEDKPGRALLIAAETAWVRALSDMMGGDLQ